MGNYIYNKEEFLIVYKSCRILDKETLSIIYSKNNTECENSSFYNLVEIPDDGKEYEPMDNYPYYREKLLDIELLRENGLNFYLEKASEYRALSFPVQVTKADGYKVIAKLNLLEETLSDLVLTAMKSGSIKKHKIKHYDTGLDEVISIDSFEVERIRDLITQKVDDLTELDVKISNKIRTANEQLAIAVFTMTEQQLNQFAMAIMGNANSIINMTDVEFDLYVNVLIGQIKAN